ncbi:MAG: hypothetical protein HY670_10575 [Chloroflexi bacterium]|nr:hypothetical protein [Chloroflexota bacterium]
MSEETKIVIALKGNTASVGVQTLGCDPVFARVEGDLPAVLQNIPGLVENARRRWEANQRYPKCETVLSPPTPAPAPSSGQSGHSSRRETATSSLPRMF